MNVRIRAYPLVVMIAVAVACTRTPSPQPWSPPPSGGAGGGSSLQNLVAPIALYPDALVAQILPASTHPDQVVAAANTLAYGARPSAAAASQWDPSIQALLSYPTVLKMMNDRIDWTTRLGQAVVANQGAVMAAIQQVRRQAQAAGNLVSNGYQVVQTQGSTIIIDPADPQYIYVPQYNPVAILSPAPYYAYTPLTTWGVGFAAGAATAYACDWGYGGYGTVTVNDNYHYSSDNTYGAYHAGASGYTVYHPQSGTYTGYDTRTGTYGAYNPSTGRYATYNPSTGAYDRDGTTGTYHPPSTTSAWGGARSTWGSDGGWGGDAFHGVGGGGWGAQDASMRGAESFGEGGAGGGFGGSWDRAGGFGGGAFGGDGFGGRGFGGGFGGFRGGGFGGRR